MSNVKCFDVANMVIEEATDRFSPIFVMNDEHLRVFQQYCDAIDMLADEFGGISYDVEVDEITMDVKVLLECDEVMIESQNHILYDLFEKTVQYGFSTSDDGNLVIKFVFPSLWVKA